MANLDAWLTDNTHAPDASERAVLAWRRIQDKPTSIVVKRDTTTLPVQTVRIEYNEAGRLVRGEAGGMSAVRDVIIFGVKHHPSVPDTDLRYGDMFALNGAIFRVVTEMSPLGEWQFTAEAVR